MSLSQSSTSTNQIDVQNLQELCQLCLQEFNSCMFYSNKVQSNDVNESNNESLKLTYLSDELIFKLTLIILMTIEQLKPKRSYTGSSNTSKTTLNIYFIGVTFALIFFSHIVNHTIIRFQESLLGLNKKSKRLSLTENIKDSDEQTDSNDEVKKIRSMKILHHLHHQIKILKIHLKKIDLIRRR